ncbi:MAG: methyltransferase domain-containing protein [Fimbriimonas sp.]|nr:methyltransferase domain-containing protein [Fimbriimonas sp.]
MIQEYQTKEKALAYLENADRIPERSHGERMVLDLLPSTTRRVLDLGTGDGRLIDLVLAVHPLATGLAVDFSEPMLERARARFANRNEVSVQYHDFADSILYLGRFDAVVSSFAIHHVEDDRKQTIYREVFEILEPGGVFVNLEHVSAPTDKLHDDFLDAMGITRETEDRSNRCTPPAIQLDWLIRAGFIDVDCFWKWRELAVLAGTKPS